MYGKSRNVGAVQLQKPSKCMFKLWLCGHLHRCGIEYKYDSYLSDVFVFGSLIKMDMNIIR